MNKLPKISVKVVGIVAVLVAILGLIYNGMTLFSAQSGAFSDLIKQQNLSRFYQAFYAMSVICIACYLLIIACGIALIQSRLNWSIILSGVLIFEVIYLLSIGLLWSRLDSSMSVAAATGVANGGLMFQVFILFPIWAPLILKWAKKKIAQETPSN